MIADLINILTFTEEKKRIASNIFYLSILQGANYLLPLVTVPYLVRVLGPENFGLLAFATATITVFMIFTDYGFNLSATSQISISRNDKFKIDEIFSSVMIIKTILMLISFGLMILLVFCFEKFSQYWEVYVITFGTVIGQVIFPVWLFQGMEKMKYIVYLNLIPKIIFTFGIFLFVNEKSDYLLVPIITSLGGIVSGICSLWLVKRLIKINFSWQPINVVKFYLVQGWHIFISSISISLYTVFTTFILGVFATNAVVGYFAGADKIVQAVKGLYNPVSQTFYPLVGKKIYEDRQSGLSYVYKVTFVVGIGMLFISVILFMFSESIVISLLGHQYQQSVPLLKIMSFLPFVISVSNLFGVQTILNLGYKKEFSIFVFLNAIVGLILAFTLTPLYMAVGISVSMLLVEVLITVMFGLFIFLKIRKGTL